MSHQFTVTSLQLTNDGRAMRIVASTTSPEHPTVTLECQGDDLEDLATAIWDAVDEDEEDQT